MVDVTFIMNIGGGAGDDFYLTYQNPSDDVDLWSDLLAGGWDGATHKNFIVNKLWGEH